MKKLIVAISGSKLAIGTTMALVARELSVATLLQGSISQGVLQIVYILGGVIILIGGVDKVVKIKKAVKEQPAAK